MVASEFYINYYAALSLGMPLVMVSGGKMLTEIVKELDGDIEVVTTFEGIGDSVTSVHPDRSHTTVPAR